MIRFILSKFREWRISEQYTQRIEKDTITGKISLLRSNYSPVIFCYANYCHLVMRENTSVYIYITLTC